MMDCEEKLLTENMSNEKDLFHLISVLLVVLVITLAWLALLNTCFIELFNGRETKWFLAIPFLSHISFYVCRDFNHVVRNYKR